MLLYDSTGKLFQDLEKDPTLSTKEYKEYSGGAGDAIKFCFKIYYSLIYKVNSKFGSWIEYLHID